MNAPFAMYTQTNFLDLLSATSSRASAAGPSPCGSQAGPQTGPCGPALVPVSRSVSPGKASAKTIPATSGPSGIGSSPSAALQSSLESRLRARLGVDGSLEYSLTWKHWPMPSREPICALRASTLRTSASACSGWPTPVANDDNKSWDAHLAMKRRMGGGRATVTSLQVMTKGLAGWPSPTARNGTGASETETRQGAPDLQTVAGWATPTVQDSANNAGPSQFRRNSLPLNCEATLAFGTHSTSSPVGMGKRGVLNPDHSRWLMGYPAGWGSCGATAMQSSRKSRRSSLKPTLKSE